MENYRQNLVDVRDFLNMQQRGSHNLTKWLRIRSLIIDKEGNTLSQLIAEIDDEFDFDYPPTLKSLEAVLKNRENL